MVTLAGTLAEGSLLASVTVTVRPLAGAAFSVTVPVEEVPPVTLVGLNEMPDTVIGLTVRVAFFVLL